MEYFEAEARINARASTVWDVITDVGNLTVWESGIAAIDGELHDGGTIRIKTSDAGKLRLRLHVRQIPGAVMTLTGGLPFGLLRRIRTFTLAPQEGRTLLVVKDEVSGPLARLRGGTRQESGRALNICVDAVAKRAELLDRSL